MYKLYVKYNELILYIFYGVLTTIVNYAVYYIATRVYQFSVIVSTFIAWILAVLFAFVTNKLFVFNSKSFKPKLLMKELSSFIICRVLSGTMDISIMWLFVDILGYNDIVIKIASNVIVTLTNYTVSKLFIFKTGGCGHEK